MADTDTKNIKENHNSEEGSNILPVLANLYEQKLEGTLCDVQFVTHNSVTWGHACVLAAFSPFFMQYFQISDSNDTDWEDHWCSKKPLIIDLEFIMEQKNNCIECTSKVVDFMYLGKVHFVKNHFKHIFSIAKVFKMDALLSLCEKYHSNAQDVILNICQPSNLPTSDLPVPDNGHDKQFRQLDSSMSTYSSLLQNKDVTPSVLHGKTIPLNKCKRSDSNTEYNKPITILENSSSNIFTGLPCDSEMANEIQPALLTTSILIDNAQEPAAVLPQSADITLSNNSCSASEITKCNGKQKNENPARKCQLVCCSPDDTEESVMKHKRRRMACKICPYTSTSILNLLKHLLDNNHIGTTCPICHLSTENSGKLKVHIHLHDDPNPFICHICGKRVRRWEPFKSHLKGHCQIKSYFCDICSTGFKWRQNLSIHLLSHEKSYVCDKCGCVLKNAKTFESHLLKHIKENNVSKEPHNPSKLHLDIPNIHKFQCQNCRVGFAHKRNLARHKNLKHGNNCNEIKCSACSYVTDRSDILKLHIKRHHGPNSSLNKEEVKENNINEQAGKLKPQKKLREQPNILGYLIPVNLSVVNDSHVSKTPSNSTCQSQSNTDTQITINTDTQITINTDTQITIVNDSSMLYNQTLNGNNFIYVNENQALSMLSKSFNPQQSENNCVGKKTVSFENKPHEESFMSGKDAEIGKGTANKKKRKGILQNKNKNWKQTKLSNDSGSIETSKPMLIPVNLPPVNEVTHSVVPSKNSNLRAVDFESERLMLNSHRTEKSNKDQDNKGLMYDGVSIPSEILPHCTSFQPLSLGTEKESISFNDSELMETNDYVDSTHSTMFNEAILPKMSHFTSDQGKVVDYGQNENHAQKYFWLNETTGEFLCSDRIMNMHILETGSNTSQDILDEKESITSSYSNSFQSTIILNETTGEISFLDLGEDLNDVSSGSQLYDFEEPGNIFNWDSSNNSFYSAWVLDETTGELNCVYFSNDQLNEPGQLILDENTGLLSSTDDGTAPFLNEDTGDLSVIYFNNKPEYWSDQDASNDGLKNTDDSQIETMSINSNDDDGIDDDFLELLNPQPLIIDEDRDERFLNELTGELCIGSESTFNVNDFCKKITENQLNISDNSHIEQNKELYLNEETGEISWNPLDEHMSEDLFPSPEPTYDFNDSLNCDDIEPFNTEMSDFSSHLYLDNNSSRDWHTFDEACDTLLNECTGELVKKT